MGFHCDWWAFCASSSRTSVFPAVEGSKVTVGDVQAQSGWDGVQQFLLSGKTLSLHRTLFWIEGRPKAAAGKEGHSLKPGL